MLEIYIKVREVNIVLKDIYKVEYFFCSYFFIEEYFFFSLDKIKFEDFLWKYELKDIWKNESL